MTVSAPASTANLGPGFDCLGAAISLDLVVSATPGEGNWTVDSEGAVLEEPLPPPDLILRAARAVNPALPELNGSVITHIPVGRGLGSSGAAVAAGLVLGCAFAGTEPDPVSLLEAGLPLEGHPDNLAASLYGGLTLVVRSGGSVQVLAFEPSSSVLPRIVVPGERLPTSQARGVLPERVPLADAVANAGWSAGLVALLTGAAPASREALLACTDDLLHQPYRASLMPRTGELVARLRSEGVAAAISGAGPSVLCLVMQQDAQRLQELVAEVEGWTLLDTDWDARGARVLDEEGSR